MFGVLSARTLKAARRAICSAFVLNFTWHARSNAAACLRLVTASVRDDSAARAGAQRLPATISYRLSSR
jgi:hypothetical protein